MLVELNDKNFVDETKEGLKLVDFYTSWCKYCKNQNPILNELSDKGFWIGKLDCDKNSQIAQKYDIVGFPSFILFKNGKVEVKFSGFHSKGELLNKLISHI
ncbi:thioredoxin family protein [bacterium]|nr:thioredoxin family protein [bacterium]